LIHPLQQHLLRLMALHKNDCLNGAGFVPMLGALYKKYPNAAQSLDWQYVCLIGYPSMATDRPTCSMALFQFNPTTCL
jgi:hypothetical protein